MRDPAPNHNDPRIGRMDRRLWLRSLWPLVAAAALREVGVHAVREWARTLLNRTAVIDPGCGPGFHHEVLVVEGLDVFAIDAAPSFVQAFW